MRTNTATSGKSTGYSASAPAVSLPKGGGAIAGIGEKFSVNPVTGTGSLSVPIAVSPGRSFAPELAVSYDSGAGNGIFGMGWDIGIASISRKTQKGLPRYLDSEDSDEFLLSGAEDLVPALQKIQTGDGIAWKLDETPNVSPETRIDATVLTQQEQRDAFLSSFPNGGGGNYIVRRYRPRTEGLFARIERWQHQETGDIHWRVTTPDNVTNVYGKDDNSRIVDPTVDPADSSRIFEWLLCESYDDKGHVIAYHYKVEDGKQVDRAVPQERNRYTEKKPTYTNRYLKRVLYGNQKPYQRSEQAEEWLFQVVFDYGEHGQWNEKKEEIGPSTPVENFGWHHRPDSFSSYRAGFEVRTQRLCRRVLMFHRFDDQGAIAQPGSGSKLWYLVSSINFKYERNPVATYLTAVTQTGYRWNFGANRYDSKSYPPVEFTYDKPELHHEIQVVDPKSLENLPVGLDNAAYQFLDLDGEGISGILTQQGGGWFYKANKGSGEFEPLRSVAKQPALVGGSSSQQRFLDLAGDGQLDLVVLNRESPGFYERSHEADWQTFKAFYDLPNVDWDDPNLRLIDLNGDGHADILLSEEQACGWHPAMAEDGCGSSTRVTKNWDEELGPALVFADANQSVYLSDMSGDGLNDIVRIRNGAVCYWPNLGYGCFGAKVTMDSPPYFDHPEMFDQGRIRLADIDGSGTTDIVYLGRDGVTLWFNQAGNSWSKGETLKQFPRVNNLTSVQVVDLLGQGTACLVWSSLLPGSASQRMQYVDLMGGCKPHLLTKTENNLGAETRLHYAPSTKFYLKDKQAGKPWITKIPFPVHVLEKTETFDRISGNRFASRYEYHHGYFDGEEREFRGFGCVEQWDTEVYETFEAEGKKSLEGEVTNGQNETHHLAPVRTRTWFHTGVYLGRARIAHLFSEEYYQGDDDAVRLNDTVLPEGLALAEEREACRALRGQMLRQEVYSEDGSKKAVHPYTVTEANYTIEVVQPKLNQRHGVFFTHARESLAYHYEREVNEKGKAHDPRIAHQITLKVDEFGNVLRALTVAYPRRVSQQKPQHEQQLKTLATLTETEVINIANKDSWYRLGVPSETRTYEVTGLTISQLENLQEVVSFSAMQEQLAEADVLPYESKAAGEKLQKRLIEHVRMRYRRNKDVGMLGAAVEALEETDSLALPLGKIDSLVLPYESYELAFTANLLKEVYGDKITSADALLIDEGRYFADADGWWVPSGRQALNAKAFYLPTQSQDPFGQITTTAYDSYNLLVTESTDPIGNTVVAEHDYWTLQPELVIDPNGNQQKVAFDALGMVVATALLDGGDDVTDVLIHLAEEEVSEFMASPKVQAFELLGQATTRIVYDLHRYKDYKQPVYAATLARETHVNNTADGELKIQMSFEYSDGFGRSLQKKIQAEAGMALKKNPQTGQFENEWADPRWVGTGRIVYNNKGKPVKQYEPFFSHTAGCETEVEMVERGVSPTIQYDPLGRVIWTDMPNGTFSKVEFDAWQQATWDENDTVAESDWYKQQTAQEQKALAEKLAETHANTPSVAHLDTLGRPFLTFAHNGFEADETAIQYGTWTEWDIEGNPLSVTDARGNTVMEYQYEIRAGEEEEDGEEGEEEAYRIYLKSMDAGERWTLYNVAGNPIREWDSRGFEVRQVYDVLQRPTHMIVQDSAGKKILAERLVYGEGHPDADARRLRGQVYQQYDGAGVVTNDQFDFKGNLEKSSRQLAKEYKTRMDWLPIGLPTDLSKQEGKLSPHEIDEIARAVNPWLEDEDPFTTLSQFDALNRPIEIVTPDKSVTVPGYNEANLLERMEVRVREAAQPTAFVKNIDYDEKGQRKRIDYGNGVTTTYDYDEKTFRLVRLKTVREAEPKRLQDLIYTYDPMGNITQIEDAAQQTIYFKGQVVSPSTKYEYDALYRLISAQGREHRGKGENNQPEHRADLNPHYDFNDITRRNLAHPHDGSAMRLYTQSYRYDAVGNILAMKHEADNNSWERVYEYADKHIEQSNRLLKTTLSGRHGEYEYDAHGNMVKMPHLDIMRWDFEDQLSATARQRVNSGTAETTYYTYDASGQRVRKVTEGFAAEGKAAPRLKERIYLGGVEIYREYSEANQAKVLERETLHVMDDEHRIAVVETETVDRREQPLDWNGRTASRIRYQLGNHLGSASVELDDEGKMLSYEEYYPYGSTAYQAGRNMAEVGLKRYRYTGKEKDEESGLYYYGVRYHACWLGRWINGDPSGLSDGVNIFQSVHSNPIALKDSSGYKARPSRRENPGRNFGRNKILFGIVGIAIGGAILFSGIGGVGVTFIGVKSLVVGKTATVMGAMQFFTANQTSISDQYKFDKAINISLKLSTSPGSLAGGLSSLLLSPVVKLTNPDVSMEDTLMMGANIGGFAQNGIGIFSRWNSFFIKGDISSSAFYFLTARHAYKAREHASALKNASISSNKQKALATHYREFSLFLQNNKSNKSSNERESLWKGISEKELKLTTRKSRVGANSNSSSSVKKLKTISEDNSLKE